MNIGKFHARGSKRYGQRTHPHDYNNNQQVVNDGSQSGNSPVQQQQQQQNNQQQSNQQQSQQLQQNNQQQNHQQQGQGQQQQQQGQGQGQVQVQGQGQQQQQQPHTSYPPKYKQYQQQQTQHQNINTNNNQTSISNGSNGGSNGSNGRSPSNYHVNNNNNNNNNHNNNNNNNNNINNNNNNNNNSNNNSYNNGGSYNGSSNSYNSNYNNSHRIGSGNIRGGRGNGRGGRGGSRGGSRGGNTNGRYRTNYYNYKSPRTLKTIITIPQFSGGVIIGVRGSLWGLLKKATTARLKVFKTTAIIRCSDAQQLDRAKEIVLKLKNTAPKYLSLIDYKGDQRLKFIQQPPNCSVVILENNINNSEKLTQEHDKELVKTHDAQFINRYNETLTLLYNDRQYQTPFIDIKTGTIWFLYNNNIPSTPMQPEKYELHTESLDSIFQTNTILNEQFIQKYCKLVKEKKPYVLITILDTTTLDIITLKCKEEKVPSSPSSSTEEYRFSSPQIYKLTHHINSKILFPQASKLGPYDLRISIDTYSKSPCTNILNNNNNNSENNNNIINNNSESYSIESSGLLQYLLNIKILKNGSNNYSFSNVDSNLFMMESIIHQKISLHRTIEDDQKIQFNLVQDLSTRFTTSTPEYNKQTNTILCTSSSLYDMFKSKQWTVEKALDEIKNLSKNIRVLASNHFDSSKSLLVPPNPLEMQSIHGNNIDDDDSSDEEENQSNNNNNNNNNMSTMINKLTDTHI